MAIKTFIDDLSTHVIERALLRTLPELLSPKVIMGLGNGRVQSIAAEPETAQEERKTLIEKQTALAYALERLSALARPGSLCKFIDWRHRT